MTCAEFGAGSRGSGTQEERSPVHRHAKFTDAFTWTGCHGSRITRAWVRWVRAPLL